MMEMLRREATREEMAAEVARNASPLARKVMTLDASGATALMKAGADPNAPTGVRWIDKPGLSLLHWVCMSMSPTERDLRASNMTMEERVSLCQAMLKALIAHGADPNAKDHQGFTPIHFLAASGRPGDFAPATL